MTTSAKPGRPRSKGRLALRIAIGGILLAIFVGAAWYLRSDRFKNLVRYKVIAYLEEATGGRVELGAFDWNLSRFQIVASNLTIHGNEAATELPFVRVDRVYARVHIVSLAQARITLRELTLDRPVVHVIVYPDGSTNIPEVKPNPASEKGVVQQLFDLAIRRGDFRRGLLVLNQRKVPFDFSANDVDARVVYDRRARRYDAKLQVGRMDAKYADWRQFAMAGSLDASCWENAVQVNSLKLSSQGSNIEVSGKLTDFNKPQVQLTYDSDFDLAQVGSITRTYALRSGTMTLNGTGSYSSTSYESTGRIALRGLHYTDSGVALRDASLNSNFTVDPQHITLSRLAARLLGGEVSGDAEVKNYLFFQPAPIARTSAASTGKTSPALAKKAPGNPQQVGTARLRLANFSLAEVARMFSTKAMPYSSLRPIGTITGTADLSWVRSISLANVDLALNVTPPSQAAAGDLPVTAVMRGQYSSANDLLTLSSLSLNTPRTQLTGSGELGKRSIGLKMAVTTSSLHEFQPLLTAMGSSPIPVELSGEASFNGTITGRMAQPDIAGHLQATNFNYVYTPAAPPAPAPAAPAVSKPSFLHRAAAAPSPPPAAAASSNPEPRRVHIDSFAGDVQFSPSSVAVHHGTAKQGDATVTFDGMATLRDGTFTQQSPFHAQAAVHNVDVASTEQMLGFDYPVKGILNLHGNVSGTLEDPQGDGEFSLGSAEAYGRPIHLLTGKIAFVNHEAQIHDINLQALRGALTGAAAFNFKAETFHFEVQGHSVDLASLPEMQSARFTTEGVLDFTAKSSGPWKQPSLQAHLEFDKLVLNGEASGGLVADAVTHGSQLQVTVRSRFPHASLAVDGNIDLRKDLLSDLTLHFEHLDIDPFLRAELRTRITGHSSMGGEAHLTGPLRQPRKLNAVLDIKAFNVEVEKIPVASDGPIQVSMQDQVLSIQRCTLVSGDSKFMASGSADMKGEQLLDLRADGHIDVKVAQTLSPDLTTYGTTDIHLKLNGTVAKPVMTGRIDVSHVGLSMIDFPAGLSDLNGSLVFSDNRLDIQKLTGRTGGGPVTFTGFVTFGRTIGFDLGATGTEIRFRYAGVSVTSDQSLRLNGTLQSSSLTGDVTVTRFAQIPSADLALGFGQASENVEVPNPNSPLNNMHLDVRILSAPELTVQTTLAKLSGDVDLRLRGTPLRPVLLGRINIAEGDIKLNGAKYHLERGDVTFSDPVHINPILDIEATTHVRDYDITIGLHGTIEKLNTTYRSDPPLSTDDIIALLAFGRTQQEANVNGTTIPQMGLAQSASNAVLGQALNSTVNNRVSKLFGVSSIRINPAIGGPNNNPSARLTVEQQVSNNVTLTYITNLTQAAEQVIQFEYNITPQYTVVGMRDENGVVSFDLLIRQRKR